MRIESKILLVLLNCIILISCGTSKFLKDLPNLSTYNKDVLFERTRVSDTIFFIRENQLRKNKQGLWELFTKGNPLERGLFTGSLTKELLQKQEDVFFSKTKKIVPSKTKQYLLQKFLAWFNRNSYLYIPNEYKVEIYGMSKFASDKYNYIANKYIRSLYLHGAHDIGHALSDLALVGCSSFAVWGSNTPDGELIIARNFDFYVGDEFAKNKIISFVEPDKGYKYFSVTWGGMLGVVSGMNDQGLTVTINAGKSDIPLVAKTPISLVTKEILQYASNIEEAINIAKKKKVFVSEAILIGSSKDNKAVIIEISPKNFDIYKVKNTSKLICTNHFQSETYSKDKNNIKQIKESHSLYRYKRMNELLKEKQITPKSAVEILRNKDGLGNKKIGYGNEKSLNQLLAHHGIVFKPKELKVWVSSNPYQLGEFVCYDLNKSFNKFKQKKYDQPIQEVDLLIEKDSFLNTKAYADYEQYRKLKKIIIEKITKKENISKTTLLKLKSLNPNYWEPYFLTGKYYYQKGYYTLALKKFEKSLNKEVTTIPNVNRIKKYIKKIKRHIK